MAKMSHDELYTLRQGLTTKAAQEVVAPYEHRAFAREYTSESPVAGSLGLAAAIPAYQAAKALGLTEMDSKSTGPSMAQVTEGFKGVGEGLVKAVKKPWEQFWNDKTNPTSLPQETKPLEQPTSSRKPWEMSWSPNGNKRLGEASRPSVAPSVENVFPHLVNQESLGQHFDKNGQLLTSSAGAQGITQVMPKTGASPGYGVTPIQSNTKEEYLRFGKDYLQAMYTEFGGDMEKALAAYNSGPANVQKAIEQAKQKKGDWKDFLPKRTETIPYINNILRRARGA